MTISWFFLTEKLVKPCTCRIVQNEQIITNTFNITIGVPWDIGWSCSRTTVYLRCFGLTISVPSWRTVLRYSCGGGWRAPPRPQAAFCGGVRWLHATSHVRFAGVWSPARVKTLLDVADADHGDNSGCHSLLGGVFFGRTISSLCSRGYPRYALSNRPAATLQRRLLLENVVLVARDLWLLKVASLVFCKTELCCVGYCLRCEALMHNVRHRQHSIVDSFPSSARPCHSLVSCRLF
jgi:hypothetical protein